MMEPWQREGKRNFSAIPRQNNLTNNLQSWQKEAGKFSANEALSTLNQYLIKDQLEICLADWQKKDKNDDTSPKDTFTLVIGNEVNLYDKVYKNHVYHIGESGQVGHSFYYVTKNGIIYSAFSFGPKNHIYGQIGSNAGTVDYKIRQAFRFHRFSITREQAIQIKNQDDIFRKKVAIPPIGFRTSKHLPIQIKPIYSPDAMLYAPIGNYTCAAMTIDTLKKAGINVPNGKGLIDASGDILKTLTQAITYNPITGRPMDEITTPISVVNPYEWYHNIVQKYGEGELYQGPGHDPKGKFQKDGFTFTKDIKILEGKPDPLIKTGQDKKILHLN